MVTLSAPSAVCPTNQEIGICGLIAATNIQSIAGYSQWSCTTLGHTSSNPCSAPVWPGMTCGAYATLSLGGIRLSGSYATVCQHIVTHYCPCNQIGSIPAAIGCLTNLGTLAVGSNKLFGLLIIKQN